MPSTPAGKQLQRRLSQQLANEKAAVSRAPQHESGRYATVKRLADDNDFTGKLSFDALVDRVCVVLQDNEMKVSELEQQFEKLFQLVKTFGFFGVIFFLIKFCSRLNKLRAFLRVNSFVARLWRKRIVCSIG